MNQNIFKCLGLSVLIVTTVMLGTNIFAEDQAVIEIHQFNDLVNITVKSSVNVEEYQVVIFKERVAYNNTIIFGSVWDDVILGGFMDNGSVALNFENEYRWFDLKTSGYGGSITLIFEGCITIERVNMLDNQGNIINTVGLPQTICE